MSPYIRRYGYSKKYIRKNKSKLVEKNIRIKAKIQLNYIIDI